MMADVVDLVGSPSPLKPTSPAKGRRGVRQSANVLHKSTRLSRNSNFDLACEVIDLAADSPRAASAAKARGGWAGSKRPRPPAEPGLDDGDILEVISPPSAGRAGCTSAPQSPARGKIWVNRIRDVFPLVSRKKVEKFLAMAWSYSAGGDPGAVFGTVMSALSEDPTGSSITEKTFAAAAIGRRHEEGGIPVTLPANASTQAGRRKVARLECQCCFDEFDFEDMVSCRAGLHLFCGTCLQRHTEQRVFGAGNLGVRPDATGGMGAGGASRATEILCMAGGCDSGFREGQLRKALPEKVMKKYNELQYAAAIESANMGDVSKCPRCEFIAVADQAVPPLLFHCPRCKFKSCRGCGEEYHPGIRCDQVETKGETDGRKVVEEAMTTAMVRTCPRPMCRKKFLKIDGCNKMTCSCGCLICYVCRKEIPPSVAYKHFCQTPHCNHKSCNKCPLYADTAEDDKARVRNAAEKAAKSVSNQVNVDLESMLKEPPPQFGRPR